MNLGIAAAVFPIIMARYYGGQPLTAVQVVLSTTAAASDWRGIGVHFLETEGLAAPIDRLTWLWLLRDSALTIQFATLGGKQWL